MRTWPTFSIRRRKGAVLAAFILLLLAAAALRIRFGSSSLSFSQVLEALAGKGTGTAASIVRHVRLPRTLAAMLAGAALAVSGVLLQAVLHNPLAGPHIIGVNAGSGFFVLGLTALWPHRPSLVPAAAFAGALLACLLIYALAVGTGASRITIVLAGVAVSGLFGAGSDALTTLFPDAAVGSNTFRMGGFSGVTMQAVGFALPYILAGLALALLLSYDMNVLALGEETAQGLGLRVGLYRFVLLVLAAVLAGGAVSLGGLLSFVGLLAPHIIRLLLGGDHRWQVPGAALLGGAFVLICDWLARMLFAPYELPVGILLNFLGVPFFLFLLFRQRRRPT